MPRSKVGIASLRTKKELEMNWQRLVCGKMKKKKKEEKKTSFWKSVHARRGTSHGSDAVGVSPFGAVASPVCCTDGKARQGDAAVRGPLAIVSWQTKG